MAKKKKKLIRKPFEKGALTDSRTLKRSGSALLTLLGICLIHLLAGSVLVFDNALVRTAANLLLLAVGCSLMAGSGISAGVSDVTHAEIVYSRLKSGHTVDRSCGFHPAKGMVNGLVGCLPFFIICVLLALTTQLQTFGLSPLPQWLAAFERQSEIGDALSYYRQASPASLPDILRIFVRVLAMPFVNIIGAENARGLLWLERFSPLICVLYALCHGAGYGMGPRMRSQVHTSIARDKRRRKRLAEKQRNQRAAETSQRLN